MRLSPQQKPGPRLVRPQAPEIEWRDYPRIQPGTYHAYCRFAKHYQDPCFRRWMCLLRWDVLADDFVSVITTVPLWLALGHGERPKASRRGNYLREWVRANGGQPPCRGDRLSPRIFVGRMARVEIADTDPEKSPIPYSVVRKVLSWETGSVAGHSVIKSHSQGRQR